MTTSSRDKVSQLRAGVGRARHVGRGDEVMPWLMPPPAPADERGMGRGEAQASARVFAAVVGVLTLAIGMFATALSHLPAENSSPSRLRSTLGAGPTSPLWWLLVLAPPALMLVAGRTAPVTVVRGWLTAIALATLMIYSILVLISA